MLVIGVTALYPIPLVWPRVAMDFKRVDAIAIHHTVTFFLRPDATVEEERAHISMIHRYHKSKGWGGFAYHLISFPSGRVYHVVPLSQWGAHVKGENYHLYGIVVAGDFTDRVPTKAQQGGVAEGIRLIYATLNRQVSIRPHRAWSTTSCPGATWKQWVPNLTALVEGEEDMDQDTFNKMFDKACEEVVVPARDAAGEPKSGERTIGAWLEYFRTRAVASGTSPEEARAIAEDVADEKVASLSVTLPVTKTG